MSDKSLKHKNLTFTDRRAASLAALAVSDIWKFERSIQKLLDVGNDALVDAALSQITPNQREQPTASVQSLCERLRLPGGLSARLFLIPIVFLPKDGTAPDIGAILAAFIKAKAIPSGSIMDMSVRYHAAEEVDNLTRSGILKILKAVLDGNVSSLLPEKPNPKKKVGRGVRGYLVGAITSNSEYEVSFLDATNQIPSLSLSILRTGSGLVDVSYPCAPSSLPSSSSAKWIVSDGTAFDEIAGFVEAAGEEKCLCKVSFRSSDLIYISLHTQTGSMIDERTFDPWALPISPSELLRRISFLSKSLEIIEPVIVLDQKHVAHPPDRCPPKLRLVVA